MTPANPLAWFALDANQGRTPEPLNVLGQDVLVKVSTADSLGALTIFHVKAPPMTGPPLHRHSREDEWFLALDGEITAEVDGRRAALQPGGSLFARRGTAHAYQNFSDRTVEMLLIVSPGGFDEFFRAVSELNEGLRTPDLAGTETLMNEHGMELLGPPLS